MSFHAALPSFGLVPRAADAPAPSRVRPLTPARTTSSVVTRGIKHVTFPWADLETAPGVYDFSAIDLELSGADWGTYRLHLTILSGVAAPDFVKTGGGSSIVVRDEVAGRTTTVGRFWTWSHQTQWQALMSALAARYDGNPLLASVTISGVGVFGAEATRLDAATEIPGAILTNGEQLCAAGLTEAERLMAITRDISFMEARWTSTPAVLPLTSYETLAGTLSDDTTRRLAGAATCTEGGPAARRGRIARLFGR